MVRPYLTPILIVGLLAIGIAPSVGAADVFRFATDLEINSGVEGNVVVLGGDLTVGPEARISGDAIAVLGTVHIDGQAKVDGRVIALPSLAALDPDPIRSASGTTLKPGLFLITGGLWLVATTLVGVIWPSRLRGAVADLRRTGWRLPFLGVVVVMTFFAALVAVLGLGPMWGVPLAGGLMVIFLMIKAVGLAVVGAWIAGMIQIQRYGTSWPISANVFVGVSILLLVRLIPIVGGTLWSLVSVGVLGVGVFSLLSEWSTSAKPVSVPLV